MAPQDFDIAGETTTAAHIAGSYKSAGLAKRKVHQAIFDATIKELFLS
ncbi:MAG: hypothetical protein HRU15_16630, partial [Planctomycetes bacterium]|nr:hypothetical protein [Planctomycetota bacterium]